VQTQFSVSQAAREISKQAGVTISPHLISNLFYRRELDDDACPIIGTARIIPASYLSAIADVLRKRGVIPAEGEAVSP